MPKSGKRELSGVDEDKDGADRLDQLEETIVRFVESVLPIGAGLGTDGE